MSTPFVESPLFGSIIEDAVKFLLQHVVKHGDGDAAPLAQHHLEAIAAATPKSDEPPAAHKLTTDQLNKAAQARGNTRLHEKNPLIEHQGEHSEPKYQGEAGAAEEYKEGDGKVHEEDESAASTEATPPASNSEEQH